jgi:hypothetical protein
MDNNLQIEDKLEKYTIHIDSLNCNLQNNNTEIYVDLDDDIKNCIYFKTLKSEIFVNSSYKYKSLIDDTNITYFRKGDEVYIDVNGIDRIIVKEKKYVPIKGNNLLQYGLEWEREFSNPNNYEEINVEIYEKLYDALNNNNWLENNILNIDNNLLTDTLKDVIQEKNTDQTQIKVKYFKHQNVFYKVKKRYYIDNNVLGTKWKKSTIKGIGKDLKNYKLLQYLHPGLNWMKVSTDIDTNFQDTLDRKNTIKYFFANYDVLNWSVWATDQNLPPGNQIDNKYIRHYLSDIDFLKWEKVDTIDETIYTINIRNDANYSTIRDIFETNSTYLISSLPEIVEINIDDWIDENIKLDNIFYRDNDIIYKPIRKTVKNNIDFNILYDSYKINFDDIDDQSYIRSNQNYYTINTKDGKTKLSLQEWKLTGINNISYKIYVEFNSEKYVPITKQYFTEKELSSMGLMGTVGKNDYIMFNENTYYLPDYDNLGNTSYVFKGTKQEITRFDITDADNYGDLVLYNNNNTESAIINNNYIDYNQLLISKTYLTDKRYYDKIDITNNLASENYIFKNELTGTSCGPNDTNTVILNPILPELKRFTVKLYKTNEFGEHEPIKIDKDGVYRVKVSFTIYYKRKKITRV